MRRAIAKWLNGCGCPAERGHKRLALRLYALASSVDPEWSVPWYNRGLVAKYEGNWEECRRCNRRATELNPEDEAGWWNLGIAATALRDWPEARRAWQKYGVQLDDGMDEVSMPTVAGCVRLNPEGAGEVVWGERIDPARTLILNIPLLGSGHRFRDIVLNDGAPEGTRFRDGVEVDVFNELEIWQASEYSTFEATLETPNEAGEQRLIEICHRYEFGVEDWSTVRILCAQCSLGNPGPHECEARTANGVRRPYAFAAKNADDLKNALHEWTADADGAAFGDIKLVLAAD